MQSFWIPAQFFPAHFMQIAKHPPPCGERMLAFLLYRMGCAVGVDVFVVCAAVDGKLRINSVGIAGIKGSVVHKIGMI